MTTTYPTRPLQLPTTTHAVPAPAPAAANTPVAAAATVFVGETDTRSHNYYDDG